jgi:hypothetical protein
VKRENADQIVKQWTNVHGLDDEPTLTETVDGYPRQVWRSSGGEEVVESYTIPQMAHGTPLAAGDSHDRCGVPGAFLLEVGISSSYHIARFWGLTGHPRPAPPQRRPARARPSPARKPRQGVTPTAARESTAAAPTSAGPVPARPIDIQAVIGIEREHVALRRADHAPVLGPVDKAVTAIGRSRHRPRRACDKRAAVAKALKAAGLWKAP